MKLCIGKYGRQREQHLKEHCPEIYTDLLMEGKLQSHLLRYDEAAFNYVDRFIEQMKITYDVTESLKARDPLVWVQKVNTIKSMAEESLFHNFLFQ